MGFLEVYRLQPHRCDPPQLFGEHCPHLRELLAPSRVEHSNVQHPLFVEPKHLTALSQHWAARHSPCCRDPVFIGQRPQTAPQRAAQHLPHPLHNPIVSRLEFRL
jgi:hypothetical protein